MPIFITLDPERDTPAVMADYVKNFSPRLVGLTGSPEQVAAAAKAYRIIFTKVEDPDFRQWLYRRPLRARLFDGPGRQLC